MTKYDVLDIINKIKYTSLAIIILLGLHSCSQEDGIITETEIIETMDTLIQNTVSVTTSGETQNYNGSLVSFRAQPDSNDNEFIHVLIYGEEHFVDGQEIFLGQPLSTQYWVTTDSLTTPGNFLVVSKGNEITGGDTEQFFEVETTNSIEGFIQGTMRSSVLSNPDSLEITGSFFVKSQPAEILEEAGIDIDDILGNLPGRAQINSDFMMATNGFCNEVFIDQDEELLVSVLFVGGSQDIDAEGVIDLEEANVEYILFTNFNEEYREGELYEAILTTETEAFFEEDRTFAAAQALGDPVFINYTSLSASINTGLILDEAERQIGVFSASVFNNCQ